MNNKTFYYEEVEKTYQRLYNDIVSLLSPMFEEHHNLLSSLINIEEIEQLPETLIWSELLEDEVNEEISEDSITSEAKEAIALKNKEEIDNLLLELNKIKEVFLKAKFFCEQQISSCAKFYGLARKIIAENAQFGLFSEFSENSLQLTGEELFAGLSVMPIEAVRHLLSSLPNSSFAVLFKEYQSGNKSGFIAAYESLGICKIDNLCWYLYPYVEKVYALEDFISDNFDWLLTIPLEMMDNFGMSEEIVDKLDPSTDSFDDDFTESDFEIGSNYINKINLGILKYYEDNQDLPRRRKNELHKIYSEYKESISHTAADEDTINIADLSPRTYKLILETRNRWIIQALHKIINENIGPNVAASPICVISQSNQRIPFPTRIEANKIDPMLNVPILEGLYKIYGRFFETYSGNLITKEEFVYLFSGGIMRPETYNPPYYWNVEPKKFAGLIRLLYIGQGHGLDKIILLVDDKGKDRSSVRWSTKKQGLGKNTLEDIENNIQTVILEVAGKRLRDVDLTRQNMPKQKNKVEIDPD